MIFNLVQRISVIALSLASFQSFATTTDPIFTIVDRAPWNAGETISASFGVSDPAGNHWVGSSSSTNAQQSGWKLRFYSQAQFAGQNRTSYPEIPGSKGYFVEGLAFKNNLVAAVGSAVSGGTGSSGIARVSYDEGQTWNDLNEYSCGTGQLTQYTSAAFSDAVTIFISGFCIDLTGAARWFVRRGIFDESEMQWFWSNSDQLVGRVGVNNFATQVLLPTFLFGDFYGDR
ncbi:MAG: hypothetical protein K2X47_19525 [Bdellovibrionales bacterium]|nr:hypothetical protein [Bdellovibrionales bacterium]